MSHVSLAIFSLAVGAGLLYYGARICLRGEDAKELSHWIAGGLTILETLVLVGVARRPGPAEPGLHEFLEPALMMVAPYLLFLYVFANLCASSLFGAVRAAAGGERWTDGAFCTALCAAVLIGCPVGLFLLWR